jgi:hypothetical protein
LLVSTDVRGLHATIYRITQRMSKHRRRGYFMGASLVMSAERRRLSARAIVSFASLIVAS